jgi:predicted HTH transcriptional regulator
MYKESETLETKSSFTAWKDIIISLSAFANKKGGKVVVGVDYRT